MDITDYERTGFMKGANARIKTSGYNVLLVSNPTIDNVDQKVKVWVAMEFDTHVRYLALVDDLELV